MCRGVACVVVLMHPQAIAPHLDKVGELGISVDGELEDLILHFALFLVIHGYIILGKACFTCPILHQHEPNHDGLCGLFSMLAGDGRVLQIYAVSLAEFLCW